MTRRREIYLQSCDIRSGFFDPRNHVIYPFQTFTNFNAHQERLSKGFGCGYIRYDDLKCDYCGEVMEGNCGGYYCAYIVWYTREEVRLNCGCHDLGKMPCFYDQQYGFHTPVEFPEQYIDSIDHVLAWQFGNKYKLNRYLGADFGVDQLKDYLGSYGFGDGGFSARGIFPGYVSYRKWNIKMEYMYMRPLIKKWTASDIARAYDDILKSVVPVSKPVRQQLALF